MYNIITSNSLCWGNNVKSLNIKWEKMSATDSHSGNNQPQEGWRQPQRAHEDDDLWIKRVNRKLWFV